MLLSRKMSELQARKARGEKGFSLIEMLVVVIIIGVIAAITVPLFLNQQEKAEDANTKTTLTTLAKALANGQGTGGSAEVGGSILTVTDGAGGITTAPLNGATVTGAADLSEGDWCVNLNGYGIGSGEASPSTSSSCVVVPCADAGGAAGTCIIGDTGPGNGIVFYVNEAAATGSRYLEAAPNTWNGGTSDPNMVHATAMSAASAYNGGGKTDWFLPSQSQLNTLYLQRNVVGGFHAAWYFSSTPYWGGRHWSQIFTNGTQNPGFADAADHVRPVRAF